MEDKTKYTTKSQLIGAALMVFVAISGGLGPIVLRGIRTNTINPVYTTLLSTSIPMLIYIYLKRRTIEVDENPFDLTEDNIGNAFKPAVIRFSMIGLVLVAMTFLSMTILPVGVSVPILQTAPIFGIIMSKYMFGTEVTNKQWLGIAAAFVGVLIINSQKIFAIKGQKKGLMNYLVGILIAFGTAMVAAYQYTQTKEMTEHVDTPDLVYYVTAFPTVLMTVLYAIYRFMPATMFKRFGINKVVPTNKQWLYYFGFYLTIGGIIATYSRGKAIELLKPLYGNLLNYLNVVFALIFAKMFLGEHISMTKMIGIATVVGGIMLTTS